MQPLKDNERAVLAQAIRDHADELRNGDITKFIYSLESYKMGLGPEGLKIYFAGLKGLENQTHDIFDIVGKNFGGKIPKGFFAEYQFNNQNIVLPQSITFIDENAFAGSNVSKIIIPDTVTLINKAAFFHCKQLVTAVVPDSVDSILDWAFGGCVNLEKVTINGKKTKIKGKSTFAACKDLTIKCHKDSATYHFAKEYDIEVEII